MPQYRLLAIAALAATLGAPAATASTIYGSATLLTARDCTGLAANLDCVPKSPAQNPSRVYTSYLGGAGASLNTTVSNGNDSWQVGTGANPGGLPVLKAGSWSAAHTRLNTNAVVFQQFTYTGATPTLLSLVGNLDFMSSGSNGLDDLGNPNTGSLNEQAGEGGIFAQMYLMSVEAFAGLTSAEQVMDLLGLGCDDARVGAHVSFSSGVLAAGNHNTTLRLDRDCGGEEMMLTHGMTGVLVMSMQTPSNRGGFSDATHTFASAFDPDLPPEHLARLQQHFEPLAIPEPSALALLLGGLIGLAGSRRLRR